MVDELLKKYPNNIKVCFVGYAEANNSKKVKEVYDHSSGINDWLTNEPTEYVESHISNMIEYSKGIKIACEKYNLRYYDTSENFTKVLDDVT